MSLINFNERILNHSFDLNSGTVSASLNDSLDFGQVIKGSGDSAYTPGVTASSNCNVTLTVTGGSSINSTTSWVVDFTGKSAGNFSFTITQPYASRALSVSGYYSNVYPGGPADEMSLGGSVSGQSVNLELGNSATTQISMGGSSARALANISSGTIDMEDFYGQSANSGPLGLPITYNPSATTYTDTNIPANAYGNNNTQITGNALWRRLRLTASSNGTYYLYIRGQRATSGNTTNWQGDMQVAAYVIDADGSNENVKTLDTPSGVMSGWKTYAQGTGANWDTNSNNWTNPTSNSPTTGGRDGRFNFRTSNVVTGSSNTGRLYNIAANYDGASNLGYGYFETTSNSAPTAAYYHARSPAFYLNSGEHLDVYYGVDCSAWQSAKFTIAS